jgi:hypothetical protein
MKKTLLLSILLLLITSPVWGFSTALQAVVSAGGTVATPYCSGANACAGDDCALLCEDFEGASACISGGDTNCRNTWTTASTTIDSKNATSPAPIQGAYSMLVDATAASVLVSSPSISADNLYGYFAVNWGTQTIANYGTSAILSLTDSATPRMYVKLNKYGTGASFKLQIQCSATTRTSTGTWTPDTGVVYHVFWEYEKAGGTAGAVRCKAGIYSDAAKTTLLAEIEDLVGDYAYTITKFSLMEADGVVDLGKFDKIKIHTSVVGGQ